MTEREILQARIEALEAKDERMVEMVKHMRKRIRAQRMQCRQTWEIVEARQKGLRRVALHYITRGREMQDRIKDLEAQLILLMKCSRGEGDEIA